MEKLIPSVALIVLITFLLKAEKIQANFEKYEQDLIKIFTNTSFKKQRTPSLDDVKRDSVNYFLFTNENPSHYIKLDHTRPYIDNHVDTIVFLIHGWTENRERQWYEDLKNAFLYRNENYYVIQVDWRDLADKNYFIAAHNTKTVGHLVAEFILNLSNTSNIPLKNILLVGHSLGGQICGFIGKKILQETGKKLPRIIALDPAGPLFFGQPAQNRLNKNDAEVVAVIHTNGGTFGYYPSCGTIDFFPNGGSYQPGCSVTDLKNITNSTAIACNHRRSWQYFIKAVLNPNAFWAEKCDNFAKYYFKRCEDEKVSLGDLHTVKTGNYYLETSSVKPFAQIDPRK